MISAMEVAPPAPCKRSPSQAILTSFIREEGRKEETDTGCRDRRKGKFRHYSITHLPRLPPLLPTIDVRNSIMTYESRTNDECSGHVRSVLVET